MDARRLGRTSRLIALTGLGAVTFLVLVPVAVNLVTGGSALRVLGPYAPWLWAALAVLSALTVCLAAWEPLRALVLRRRPSHPANRRAALDRVERFVRARVDGSLAEQVRLKLGVVPRVGPRLPTRIRHPLVVVGEPGSGKTALLLSLAETLAARARQDLSLPVPVVVDLGGWQRDDDFGEWLLRVLSSRYRIGARLGRVWLRQGNLVLLFDGLDDLSPADRVECLAWITALKLREVVLCGAGDEHRHLPRCDVVRVDPLGRNEVLDLITACAPRLDGLREALEKDPELWDEVRTPLAFGLLALAYRAGRAEYRGVLDTYLVESVARDPSGTSGSHGSAGSLGSPGSPGRSGASGSPGTSGSSGSERLVRALRFLARIARRRGDLQARSRLPSREVWLDFVGTDVVWRLFGRAAPGALAGAATALCFVVGVRLGLVAAAVTAVATVGVPRSAFIAVRGDVRRGRRWAVTGFVAGVLITGVVALLGGLLGALVPGWPPAVGYGVVVVVALLVAYGNTRDRYWALACALVPVGVMVVTGPGSDLPVGLGIGLASGAVAGAFIGGLRGVWAGLHTRGAIGLRWLPVAGLVGVGSAALAGAAVRPSALGAVTGVLLGLAVAPVVNRPFDPVAGLLARPLALDEFPLGRKAILQSARDRVLLVDEHRFPHDLVRDHLASCDPVEVAATVERRRAGLSPTGSDPMA
ncbi:NACHT domain-containing protein [Saccharothrix sp. NRRL B-16314]|uniref:NACHT domain-containing protein n=1 Tax=Saccharothrix sp. NRRL B-16314 TaxID=1463825 RepID=UPI0005243CD4|nr:NACHT domain-containing protein [Saccharothrix sp. NRRL B-16314]